MFESSLALVWLVEIEKKIRRRRKAMEESELFFGLERQWEERERENIHFLLIISDS